MINLTLYPKQFWLLCVSSLLFFASFNMIIPELSDYLTGLGGADYKGLIISLFTVTAMLSRPFSGRLADTIGRVPVMIFGSVVCCICSLIYPLLTTVSGFLLLRLVHGFSTGFTPTGQTTYIADIIPAHRRGEAMGLLGTASSVGMAGGPAIGGVVTAHFGIDVMFYLSSIFGIGSILILTGIKETLKEKHRFGLSAVKVKVADLFEPRVAAPCLVMVLAAYAYGAMFTLLPDVGEYLGVKNKGLLFAYLTIASLTVRLGGGRASDRWGRKPVLRVSTALIILSMIMLALADTKLMLISGVVLYGFGQGTASPTLMAWATDLSHEEFKARGIASLFIFMEMGIGLGAFGSGLIYANQSSNFFITFVSCSVFAALAFIFLCVHKNDKRVGV